MQALPFEVTEINSGSAAISKMGHSGAFDDLYKRHAEKMFRITCRITRNREDAEDAVQECFLNAFLHLKSFDGRSRFSAWLTRIAMNAALMKLRKKPPSREVPIDALCEDRAGSNPERCHCEAVAKNSEGSRDSCATGMFF